MSNNIREQKIETLNELIGITRDSADFYKDAALKVDNPRLKSLFTDLSVSKRHLVDAMAVDVQAEGAKPAQSGTFRGSVHQLYGDIRAKLGDTDYAYVSELEESEDRILDAMKDVVQDTDTPRPVKEAVLAYLPTAKAQHDLMREQKWSMQPRH